MTWIQRHRLRRYVNDSLWIGPCVGIVAAMVAARAVHSVDGALGWKCPSSRTRPARC